MDIYSQKFLMELIFKTFEVMIDTLSCMNSTVELQQYNHIDIVNLRDTHTMQ